MFLLKRFSILVVTAVVAVSAVSAQTQSQSGRERTIEESYLQESIELMIIRETARADSRDQKLIALDYIRDAINRGNKNDEIRQTLDYLSREGRNSVNRQNGRIINNFPDVRRQAAIWDRWVRKKPKDRSWILPSMKMNLWFFRKR